MREMVHINSRLSSMSPIKWGQRAVLATALPLLFSCASNGFFKSDAEDLNALTYGNPKAPAKSWSPQRIRVQPEDFNADSRYNGNARGVASTYNTSTEAATQQGEGFLGGIFQRHPSAAELDPTNEQVRQHIENARRKTLDQGQDIAGRHTKQDFWDNAPGDGSLWSGEGDVNFFFTRARIYNAGDIVSIKAEESLIKQIANQVKKGLTIPEQQVELTLFTKGAGTADADGKRGLASLGEDDLNGGAAEAYSKMNKALLWSQVDLTKTISIQPEETLRAEVLERYPNGNYKIRAVKQISYRGRPRLVTLVGIAPAEDFDEQANITSGKLYEHQMQVSR